MKHLIIIAACLCSVFLLSNSNPADDNEAKAKTLSYIKKELISLISQVDSLNDYANRSDAGKLQHSFRQLRLTFKKIDPFLAGLPFSYPQINGPAVLKSFEYNPSITVEPHGLQVIEQFLFPAFQNEKKDQLISETSLLKETLAGLLNEFDQQFLYSDYSVWEKLRNHLIYTGSLGITGYDSPLALYSIPETKAALGTLQIIAGYYEKELETYQPGSVAMIGSLLKKAEQFYAGKNFNSFNRLEFSRQILNPLYKITAGFARHWLPPGYKNNSYVRYDASSLFEKGVFSFRNAEQNPDNAFDEKKAALGKKLFYDVALSKDNNLSCASCHLPDKGFADGLKVPKSFNNEICLKRNTPTLLNAAFQSRFFFDSRSGSLESQSVAVITNKCEGNENTYHLAERISSNKYYLDEFKKLYKIVNEQVSIHQLSNAVASYIKSLEYFDTDFDAYMRGEKNNLTIAAKRGYNLFAGKAKCGTCHFAPLFNGAVPPLYIETESEVLGVPANPNSKKMIIDPDEGKFLNTHNPVDRYSFKIPSLRNISLTAPYMHNGAYKTLVEVIEFYNKGGGAGIGLSLPNQTLPAEKLGLSLTEKNDLLAFLNTLTDKRLLKKTKTGISH